MERGEVATGVAVIALTGVITYLFKAGVITWKTMAKGDPSTAVVGPSVDDAQGGGGVGNFISGPAIYSANTPWLFGAQSGNVIPPNSAGVTLPGAVAADFLGFTSSAN